MIISSQGFAKLCLALLLLVPLTMAIVNDFRFRSSLCYDMDGSVVVSLQCPDNYVIRTRAAFTGISRTNGCAFVPKDCAIHEGRTYKCDGNNKCQVHVTFQQKDADMLPLTCNGGQGSTAYFQVEYDCLTASGSVLSASNFSLLQEEVILTETDDSDPVLTFFPPRNITTADESVVDGGPLEGKIKIMGIVAGSGGALVIIISILAVIVRRLHKKSYPNSPCYPAPPPPPSSSSFAPSRRSGRSQWSMDRSAHHLGEDSGLGQGSSDLSVPGSVSSLFPKQSLRDFQLLRGYPPRGVAGSAGRPSTSSSRPASSHMESSHHGSSHHHRRRDASL